MTPEEETVVRRGIVALKVAHRELCYYSERYHATRGALIGCRLDKIELERMVESLQEQLGEKGPDIKLGDDDLDVV